MVAQGLIVIGVGVAAAVGFGTAARSKRYIGRIIEIILRVYGQEVPSDAVARRTPYARAVLVSGAVAGAGVAVAGILITLQGS